MKTLSKYLWVGGWAGGWSGGWAFLLGGASLNRQAQLAERVLIIITTPVLLALPLKSSACRLSLFRIRIFAYKHADDGWRFTGIEFADGSSAGAMRDSHIIRMSCLGNCKGHPVATTKLSDAQSYYGRRLVSRGGFGQQGRGWWQRWGRGMGAPTSGRIPWPTTHHRYTVLPSCSPLP